MATMDNYKIVMDVVGEGAVISATNALKTFGGVIGGIATLQFAQGVLTLADNMSDLAESTGLSMAAVTGFSAAVAAAGGNFENAGKGIRTFYKNLEEAGGDQTSKAAEALQKVGIGLDDIRTKSEGQLLVQAIDELAKMGAGAKQTAAMMELFGKGLAGVEFGVFKEALKTIPAEELAEKFAKVKEANDKMGLAMLNFKAAAAGAMGPLMPLFEGLVSVIGVVAKHLDVLGIAMGVVFGAGMLANIGKITTAMRLFAASNPFTLIAMAVGTLVVTVAELIDTYGSFGNAMKAVGNMGISLVNTLFNAWKGYGLFMANLMTGVGNAILAGLNPFSSKSAMSELQTGFQKGVNAFKQQMASEGAIKFKFAVQPVVKKKGGSALDALLADEGGLGDSATGRTKQQADARGKEALAAQQVTDQMRLQNDEANKLRQLSIGLLGVESARANLIQANAKAESDGLKQVADLEAKINAERAKGAQRNDEVIAQLQQQKTIVNGQVIEATRLNELEYQRTQQLRLQQSELTYELEKIKLMAEVVQSSKQKEIRDDLLRGRIGKEEYDRKMNLHDAETKHLIEVAKLDKLIRVEREKAIPDSTKIKEYEIDVKNLEIAWKRTTATIEEQNLTVDALAESAVAGARSALERIKDSVSPFQVAQEQTAMLFQRMSQGLDEFVTTGKLNFKNFALSLIRDLIMIQVKAQAMKWLSGAMGGSFLGSLFGIPQLAKGGPATAGQPYIVGEQGPELFVPKNAGTVIPAGPTQAMTSGKATGAISAPISNTYITNNISAMDAKSVAQLFVENRKTLLGTVNMARKEMPYAA